MFSYFLFKEKFFEVVKFVFFGNFYVVLLN